MLQMGVCRVCVQSVFSYYLSENTCSEVGNCSYSANYIITWLNLCIGNASLILHWCLTLNYYTLINLVHIQAGIIHFLFCCLSVWCFEISYAASLPAHYHFSV